jgi:hypothetical protein
MRTQKLPLPVALDYIYRNDVFTGVALARFEIAADAQTVLNALHNKRAFGTRLSVTRKKPHSAGKLAEDFTIQHLELFAAIASSPHINFNEPANLLIYTTLFYRRYLQDHRRTALPGLPTAYHRTVCLIELHLEEIEEYLSAHCPHVFQE